MADVQESNGEQGTEEYRDVGQPNEPISAAVETRDEKRRVNRPLKPLVTPDIKLDEINAERLQQLQKGPYPTAGWGESHLAKCLSWIHPSTASLWI